MRVLVTGHDGYIGSVLVPMLLKKGFHTIGLDSYLFDECTFGPHPPEHIPHIREDIRDITRFDLEGFDAIIHLAALSNDPLGDFHPSLTYAINHKASVHLAKLAKKAGVERFIFSSSCSTYGSAGDELLTEDAKFNPVTPYGNSKVWVERDISKLANHRFSPSFLRNTTAYGVSPRLRFDLVLNNLVAWAFTTKKVHLKSDGLAYRPLIHVEDIARAFVSALESPRDAVHNESFNVGRTEENFQVRELASVVKKTVPKCNIEFGKGAGHDKRNYKVNFSKIKHMLPKFRPRWTVSEGARELYRAYKKIGLALKDFEGPRYKRIEHLKYLLKQKRIDKSLRWKN